jgi:hypothetical protein
VTATTPTPTNPPAMSVGAAVAPPSAHALDEVLALTRRLLMPYLRKAAADVLPTAGAQRWSRHACWRPRSG